MSKKSCVTTGMYPKAQIRTRGQMALLIKEPGLKEVYRQTRKRKLGKWYFPKALMSDGNWRPINNGKYVIGKWIRGIDGKQSIQKDKDGNKFALWRMWDIKRRAKTKAGKRKWEPQIYIVYYSKVYTIYYLVCRQLHQSIQGVY